MRQAGARFAIQLAGSHALRGPSRAVTRAEIPELKPLIAAMQDHVAKEKAQGLCAPQMGEPLRLFLFKPDSKDADADEYYEDDEEEEAEPTVVLNPQILKRSQVQDVDWESCLSVPDHGALVYRPQKVMVSYETLDGETVERTLKGNDARVFQHEYDHLDGILYTSRMIAKSFTHMDILKDDEAREAVEEHLHESGALAEAQAEQQRLQERRAKSRR